MTAIVHSRVAALLIAICLAPACGDPIEHSEKGALDSEAQEAVSAEGILVCEPAPGSPPSAKDAWYSLPAMNNKLRHFPAFASASGLTKVQSCAEARIFMQRYRDHLRAVPHFDRDEPIELVKSATPERPQVTEEALIAAAGIASKIKNGSADRLSPVVRLMHFPGGVATGKECTGTFIARNWIMTAAHCLQTANGWNVSQGPAAAKLRGWYRYAVEYFGPQGLTARIADYWYVRQYLDPRFVGFEQSFHYASFDFALLYVIDTLDNGLPNLDPSLSISTFPVMRVSLVNNLVDPGATQFWGTGNQGKPVASSDPVLFRGSLVPYNSTFAAEIEEGAFLENPGRIYTANVPPTAAAYVCTGDSGGPLVDRFGTDYVAAGVVSGFWDRNSPDQPPSATCADATSFSVDWVPTDDEQIFIESWVSDWYPHFPCKRLLRAGSSTQAYLECWGKPCKDDTVCTNKEYCSHPGSELKMCNCAGGGCGCIFGQCLPKEE